MVDLKKSFKANGIVALRGRREADGTVTMTVAFVDGSVRKIGFDADFVRNCSQKPAK